MKLESKICYMFLRQNMFFIYLHITYSKHYIYIYIYSNNRIIFYQFAGHSQLFFQIYLKDILYWYSVNALSKWFIGLSKNPAVIYIDWNKQSQFIVRS